MFKTIIASMSALLCRTVLPHEQSYSSKPATEHLLIEGFVVEKM